MLRFIKIASVVTAMVFFGISPAFAATPTGTGPTGGVDPAVVNYSTMSAVTVSGSDSIDGPAESFYTMPDGTVDLGVQNADGSWSAPANQVAAQQ